MVSDNVEIQRGGCHSNHQGMIWRKEKISDDISKKVGFMWKGDGPKPAGGNKVLDPPSNASSSQTDHWEPRMCPPSSLKGCMNSWLEYKFLKSEYFSYNSQGWDLNHLNSSFDIFPGVTLQTPAQRPKETATTYWTTVLFSSDT